MTTCTAIIRLCKTHYRQKQGQFIFTGSAVPTNSEEIIHSGAGRFAWLTMRTMSLYESKESTGEVSLKKLFTNPKNILGVSNLDIEELSYIICRGGWPQAINMKKEIALMQAYLYYDAIIKSEINRADGINKNPERVKRIMRSFARNQCAQTSANTIKQDIVSNEAENTNENTILSYINALKKIFVIEDMPSWNPNLRSKTAIRTSDTRYCSDPSIGVAALGLGPNDLIQDIQTLG